MVNRIKLKKMFEFYLKIIEKSRQNENIYSKYNFKVFKRRL